MERITIGNSDLTVSRVALGTWAIGGWMWGGTDEKESIATVREAVDRGVTLIDTAPVYGFGRSEEIVGKALAEGGLRGEVHIATKAGLDWRDGEVWRDSRPERIRREVEDSLRRLGVDVIDLYQIHWPDLQAPFAKTAEVMAKLQEEGKIRAIGVSNYSPDEMDAFAEAADLDAVQPPYNLFERGAEDDVLPYAQEQGLTVLAYGVLCRGMLSGKMDADRDFDGDDLRRHDPKFQEPRFSRYLAAVDELAALARERWDKSVLQLAVRWVLDQGPTIALWGARRPGQVKPVDGIDGWSLDDEAKREIDAILDRHIDEAVSPAFMAPPEKRPEKD